MPIKKRWAQGWSIIQVNYTLESYHRVSIIIQECCSRERYSLVSSGKNFVIPFYYSRSCSKFILQFFLSHQRALNDKSYAFFLLLLLFLCGGLSCFTLDTLSFIPNNIFRNGQLYIGGRELNRKHYSISSLNEIQLSARGTL